MAYLIAAYGVIWLVLFGFVLNMASRQRRLSAEVENLRRQLSRAGDEHAR